jgi:thiamine biosynthesis lipoprotein ApbE
MCRARWTLALGLLALCGCNRTQEYVDVTRAQEKAVRSVTAVLAEIRDEKDMAAAKEELDDRFARYEKIARKARELPRPPQPEVGTPLADAAFSLQKAFKEMREEIARVQGLRGGAEFFAQFEGSVP